MKNTKPTPSIRIVPVDGVECSIPEYATQGSAGFDLRCACDFTLAPNGGTAMVRTGLVFAIPDGLEGQIRPRSGLAAKYAVTVLNAPGTIDSDYRGEVSILLINHGTSAFHGQLGDRVAQMVIAPVIQPNISVVSSVAALGSTERGQGGFGSTGVSSEMSLDRDN